MKLLSKIAGVWSAVATLFFITSVALAQSDPSIGASTPIGLTNPLSTTCTSGASGGQCFLTVMNQVIGFIFWDIALPLTTIMVLVGAFQMMTSAGDPEKFSKGKNTLIYAAIGFAVALMAGGVSTFVKTLLGQ